MPPGNFGIVAEMLGKHGPRIFLLCMLPLAVVAVSLAIINTLLRNRRTAARRQRESDAQDEARLADRLSELAHRGHGAIEERDRP